MKFITPLIDVLTRHRIGDVERLVSMEFVLGLFAVAAQFVGFSQIARIPSGSSSAASMRTVAALATAP